MARRGPQNLGTENLGTARPAKYWQGKIMALHGTDKSHKIDFVTKYLWIWVHKIVFTGGLPPPRPPAVPGGLPAPQTPGGGPAAPRAPLLNF